MVIILGLFSKDGNCDSGAIFHAVDILVKQMGRSMKDLPEKVKAISIGKVETSIEIENDVKTYLISKIETIVVDRKFDVFFIQCKECITQEGSAEHGEVLETDEEEKKYKKNIKTMLNRGINHYAKIKFTYSSRMCELEIQVLDNNTHKTVWSNSFSTRLLHKEKFAIKFSPTILSGTSEQNLGLSIYFGDRIFGLGEIGAITTMIMASADTKSIFYLGPRFSINIDEVFRPILGWGDIFMFAALGYGSFDSVRQYVFEFGFKFEIRSYFHILLKIIKGQGITDDKTSSTGANSADNSASDGYPLTPTVGVGLDF